MSTTTISPKLVCLGNPLLDIQATVTEEYLAKYDLKANDAVLVDASSDEPKMAIFEELLQFKDVKFIAGGAAQNTARGAAYMLGKDQVGYFGSVGKDTYSAKLLAENKAAGVVSYYQEQSTVGTGKCAALITGHNRSLVTDLGAANHFTPDHLDKHWSVVEQAKLFYVGGFHLTVSPEAIVKLGKHAQETGKPLVLNLSAPFIPQFFKAALEQALPYTTYVIANESEAAAYAESFGVKCKSDDLVSIAKHIVGDSKTRTVIFTHGLEPTVIVSAQGEQTRAVKALPEEKIVDTNGAGDAFAAGFMAGLTEGKNLDQSVDMGQWLAALSIQEVGAAYPTEKLTYQA
ncbi:LANO_0E05974g1_1 [Lachancea nothofagi CBS 11611]|uniref:Adenosine kinase n=1 Tax=Lachancea nothofagi CBS 11611 TaxID=1266666 RepID=A0A1G4JTH6_9SACH|nr:LANO_0E05974g1_1 [Lachancea nothofagi CBS 11611]